MGQAKFFYLCLVFIFLLMPFRVWAKVEITESPGEIKTDEEFLVSVSLSKLTGDEQYLSIAVHAKDKEPYFAQTYNGEAWIDADDANCKSFPKADMNEGSWSGQLKGRVNHGIKDYRNTTGEHTLRVIKYTGSCSKTLSDEVRLTVNDPNPPTSTIEPTIKPTLTKKPTVEKAPSAAKPVKEPSPKTLNSVQTAFIDDSRAIDAFEESGFSASITAEDDAEESEPQTESYHVLGMTSIEKETDDASESSSISKRAGFAVFFFAGGMGGLVYSAYRIYQKMRGRQHYDRF